MSRPLFSLLAASLALNLAFAVVFGLGVRPPPVPTAAIAVTPDKPSPPAITADVWPGLKTADLRALIARLREAGFPPDIIRALIAAEVSDSFAARRKALQPDATRQAFWKEAVQNPGSAAAAQRLYGEEQKILRDLLGENFDSTNHLYLTQQGGRLDFLPTEKADEIRRILRHYQEKTSESYVAGTYNETVTALQREQHAEIARHLTPEELFDYDLRNSPGARMLRSNLATLAPTEEEFRTIYRLRQAFDAQYLNLTSVLPTPDQQRQRAEAEKLVNAQIMAALPPDRAAEYERSTDYNYRLTGQFVARLQLPPETTLNLWTARQAFEKRLDEIMTAPPDQRAELFTTAKTDTLAKVSALLAGASRVDTYKLYGGNWLQTTLPSSRPAP